MSPGRCAAAISDTDWEGLVVGFRAQGDAGEAALQQRHESGVPITNDKEQQKWDGDIVLVLDRVDDGESEISANQQLDPRNPAQALAIFCRAYFVFLRNHVIFRSAREGTLFADESFDTAFVLVMVRPMPSAIRNGR